MSGALKAMSAAGFIARLRVSIRKSRSGGKWHGASRSKSTLSPDIVAYALRGIINKNDARRKAICRRKKKRRGKEVIVRMGVEEIAGQRRYARKAGKKREKAKKQQSHRWRKKHGAAARRALRRKMAMASLFKTEEVVASARSGVAHLL